MKKYTEDLSQAKLITAFSAIFDDHAGSGKNPVVEKIDMPTNTFVPVLGGSSSNGKDFAQLLLELSVKGQADK